MKKINIIIPVYNEEDNITPIYHAIQSLKIDFLVEYIFVDDGSQDKTIDILKNLSKKNKLVKYISFSRNFGHQIALSAGLDHSDGEIVIMMDADLQHPVKYIPEMINKYKIKVVLIDPTPRAIAHISEVSRSLGKSKTRDFFIILANFSLNIIIVFTITIRIIDNYITI